MLKFLYKSNTTSLFYTPDTLHFSPFITPPQMYSHPALNLGRNIKVPRKPGGSVGGFILGGGRYIWAKKIKILIFAGKSRVAQNLQKIPNFKEL